MPGKVTYKPGPGEPDSLQWGGKTFKAGEAVDVEDPRMLEKAKNNPYFETSGGDKPKGEEREVLGNYQDTYTGQEFDLVRKKSLYSYGPGAGPAEIAKPSSATQGSTAIESSRPTGAMEENPAFEQNYGAKQSEFVTGEYEGAPKPTDVKQGTEGQSRPRGRPPGSGKK